MAQPPGNVTQLLAAAGGGDDDARNRLFALLYEELRRMAHQKLAHESPACDRQTTSLVHDAFIRLAGAENMNFSNRQHFFGSASRVMRQILVEDARKRGRQKRGGGEQPVSLQFDPVGRDSDPDEILGVDEALKRLAAVDARKAQIVEYRYFAGMTGEETAGVLGVSARTVDSEWQFARAWLHRELQKGTSHTD